MGKGVKLIDFMDTERTVALIELFNFCSFRSDLLEELIGIAELLLLWTITSLFSGYFQIWDAESEQTVAVAGMLYFRNELGVVGDLFGAFQELDC